jgi:REP element-mobilizing transposase RayT
MVHPLPDWQLRGFMVQSRIMSTPAQSTGSGIPRNPGVHELVIAKRRWSSAPQLKDLRRGFRGWHERGYLPHRDEPGLVQFVTWHLADSFPACLRSEWEALLPVENDLKRRLLLEAYLDTGRGECFLRRPKIAGIVESAMLFHHLKLYELRGWCIMPNHLHLLVKVAGTPLAKIVHELKRYSAREANKILGRTGAFWCEDYFDTYMRNSEHEVQTRRYIESNPMKAKIVRDSKAWPWSSARFRDEHEALHL